MNKSMGQPYKRKMDEVGLSHMTKAPLPTEMSKGQSDNTK